jgi:hypothetical protein
MTTKVDVELTEEDVKNLLKLLYGLVEEPWVSLRTKLEASKNG